MNIWFRCIAILFICWGTAVKAWSQDTKLPHPFMWKSFNNPGYTGFDGFMNVNLGMRRAYWSNPLDFRTYFVSVDYPFKDKKTLGLGGISLFYQRDQENSIKYVTNSISAAISARIKVSRTSVLQVGLQPALYLKNLDTRRITLGDQFDPYYGQVLGLSPELIDFYSDNLALFDIGAGIYGKTDFYLGTSGLAGIEYGFSVYHIIESTQSFLSEHGSLNSEENLLNRRYSGYFSYKHPVHINYRISTILSPYVMVDIQSVMKNIQFGLFWEEEKMGMLGIGFRSNQFKGFNVGTFLVNLGVTIPQSERQGWRIGYTFEVPTSQGTMYKNTSHSLSVHWYFKATPQRCMSVYDHKPSYNNKQKRKNKGPDRQFGY